LAICSPGTRGGGCRNVCRRNEPRSGQIAELFVFGTSAWITLDEKEPGAEQVESLLADAWLGKAQIGASFVTLTELE
jgi:hypothetical protein